MITKTSIVRNVENEEWVSVEFDDNTFVLLSEEELKNAGILAEKGAL